MPRQPKKVTVSYQVVEGVPEEEIQRRIDRAFDILFDEVDRKRAQRNNVSLTKIDNKE
ncbi:MAG: hypothetical protein WD000_10205 [Thermodesulfobacteriota bacterium]